MNIFYKTFEINHFYPELVKMDEIQNALKSELGDSEADRIMNEFMIGIPYDQIKGDFEDVIRDYIEIEKLEKDVLYGLGYGGEFPIYIMNFGPLYWVEVQEFDNIQFFKSYKDARSCAKSEYAPFIELLDESESDFDKNEDEDIQGDIN